MSRFTTKRIITPTPSSLSIGIDLIFVCCVRPVSIFSTAIVTAQRFHLYQKIVMLRKVSGEHRIHVPVKNLDANEPIPKSWVVTCFLKQMSYYKAAEGFGYFLAVTKLKSIDNGRKISENSNCLEFLVAFQCRTFLPVAGEVLVGMVRLVCPYGVYLKSGPANYIYISAIKMPNYHYAPGQKPHFLSDDLSRIEKGVVVRFMVFATRWNKERREIDTLASLEGDGLGPVSLAGTDGLQL